MRLLQWHFGWKVTIAIGPEEASRAGAARTVKASLPDNSVTHYITRPTENLLEDTDGFLRPLIKRGANQPTNDRTVQCSLLRLLSADVRSSDDVIAFEGPGG